MAATGPCEERAGLSWCLFAGVRHPSTLPADVVGGSSGVPCLAGGTSDSGAGGTSDHKLRDRITAVLGQNPALPLPLVDRHIGEPLTQ